jgi:hypothetical protein
LYLRKRAVPNQTIGETLLFPGLLSPVADLQAGYFILPQWGLHVYGAGSVG